MFTNEKYFKLCKGRKGKNSQGANFILDLCDEGSENVFFGYVLLTIIKSRKTFKMYYKVCIECFK